jgi:polysaccharide export outer membrane protein
MTHARALALAALCAGCGPAIHYDYSKEPDPRKQEYVIGAADGLHITVWNNPQLSTDVHVRPDGTITLPLLGDVAAAGKTPGQLKWEVIKKLQQFVKDESAVVTIAVSDPNSYRFMVSGNVEHSGMFTAKYFVTVSEALAMAGGPNKFAGYLVTIVRSSGDGQVRRIPIDYRRVASGAHPDENLPLISGDILFVN